MRGDLENLYDAHAPRLYAHGWSLLGDRGAADALNVTLTEAVAHPPRGETVLWLHRVVRAVCSERGAFSRHGHPVFAPAATDPLLDAVGALPAEHREALLLSAGEWLGVRDISRVIGISPGAVRELLHEARTALERLVLDALMRGAADPARHMDVIAAFEKGRLQHLLARRAPDGPPASLRDHLLAAADREYDEIGRAPAEPTGRLVVIGSDTGTDDPERDRARRRKAALKSAGGVAGVAASVATGLIMTWPSAGANTVNAFGPIDGGSRPGTAPAGNITDDPTHTEQPGDGQQSNPPAPRPTSQQRSPVTEESAGSGGGASAPATPSGNDTPSAPSTPSSPSTPPPPDSRQETPPPPEDPPEQPSSNESHHNNPLEPVTDIVGHLTSPILGGLIGQ